MNKLIENVMRLLHHRLKQLPPNMITLALAHDLPAIKGNPAELEQVILNLVLNALDAVDGTAGEIVLGTHSKDGDWVILEVRDNGHGIDIDDATLHRFYYQ